MNTKQNTGSLNPQLINTSEYYEVEYWAKKFNVRVEQLKSAVSAVGNSAAAVEKYFNK